MKMTKLILHGTTPKKQRKRTQKEIEESRHSDIKISLNLIKIDKKFL